jgi:hypothetical protein
MKVRTLARDRLDIASEGIRRYRSRRQDVHGDVIWSRLERDRRQPRVARGLVGSHIGTGHQTRWSSPRQLKKVVDGSLPLVHLDAIAGSQTRSLPHFFKVAQLVHSAIKVGEGCSGGLLVTSRAGAGQLAEPGLDPAEAIPIKLLRLLRDQLVFPSDEVSETRDIDATAKGTFDLGRGETGGIPLIARPPDSWSGNDRRPDRRVAGRAATPALRRHYAASHPRTGGR